MAIIQGNAKQGSTRGFYPKVINGSLRFNDDDSAYLSWTPASTGNRKTWTWSGWVKNSGANTSADNYLISANNGSSDFTSFGIENSSGSLLYFTYTGASYVQLLRTTAKFRDPSAWYHIVFVYDSTDATSSDRLKIYVNGVRQTDFVNATYPSSNYDAFFNSSSYTHYLGTQTTGASYLDGYLANVHFIDGQALTASDFGETKNGVWVAKDYAGTFGTNGFYLTFEDDTQVEAFNTVLVNGSNKSQKVTGYGFAPDLLWFKNRTSAGSNFVVDTVRGTGKALGTDRTDAEFVGADKEISFDSDGFTTPDGVTGNMTGDNGQNYVVWGWKAGDSNVSNTDGTITSTVRANDTYGFSIVSWTGSGSTATVGHGLSTSAPKFIIIKNRTDAEVWRVYHASLGATVGLQLNATSNDVDNTNTGIFNDTEPTSSVFTVNTFNSANGTSDNMIAYCWSETTGYSKFGSYIGNGSTTGPSITCGFKPSMILIKRTDTTGNWVMSDTTRDVDGTLDRYLLANSSDAEGDTTGNSAGNAITITDTGFQLANTNADRNASGGTYIYAAFADTREAAFWLDQSGNDNDWQPVNLDHNDTVADSPTNNFATLNPLTGSTGLTFSDGNLKVDSSGSGTPWQHSVSTIAIGSGQWYWEATRTGSAEGIIAITDANSTTSTQDNDLDELIGYRNNGTKYVGGSNTAYGASWTAGDVLSVALDMEAGTVTFYKNNVSQGSLSHSFDLVYADFISADTSGWNINFGQQPFKYDPPA